MKVVGRFSGMLLPSAKCSRPLAVGKIPFGELIEYHPISPTDQARIHQFGEKVLPGILPGYALHAGGIWEGDIFGDMEELENLDASEFSCSKTQMRQ